MLLMMMSKSVCCWGVVPLSCHFCACFYGCVLWVPCFSPKVYLKFVSSFFLTTAVIGACERTVNVAALWQIHIRFMLDRLSGAWLHLFISNNLKPKTVVFHLRYFCDHRWIKYLEWRRVSPVALLKTFLISQDLRDTPVAGQHLRCLNWGLSLTG